MVYILIRKLSLFFSSKVPDIYKVACEKLQYSRMFRSAFLGYLREGFFFFFFSEGVGVWPSLCFLKPKEFFCCLYRLRLGYLDTGE